VTRARWEHRPAATQRVARVGQLRHDRKAGRHPVAAGPVLGGVREPLVHFQEDHHGLHLGQAEQQRIDVGAAEGAAGQVKDRPAPAVHEFLPDQLLQGGQHERAAGVRDGQRLHVQLSNFQARPAHAAGQRDVVDDLR